MKITIKNPISGLISAAVATAPGWPGANRSGLTPKPGSNFLRLSSFGRSV